ncbi:hypothetical protein K443DRAFT_682958 [Laccaria amethystina LaAM-08-1]|uniref:Uncharacterized protein n=1 Tax=Laccaria amethystina LaAM-08-1 TaxID=1095629 RepID=A0A0C9XCR7_9AGAR|nr:hypothetical protein K443DRAFT_682958 [Laccaria amethystina LaAM-08-1]
MANHNVSAIRHPGILAVSAPHLIRTALEGALVSQAVCRWTPLHFFAQTAQGQIGE